MKIINISKDEKDILNRARLFWKTVAVIFFLTTITGAIAWKIESYGRSMDAKVIRLETEKALRGSESNATGTSTPVTMPTPSPSPKAQ